MRAAFDENLDSIREVLALHGGMSNSLADWVDALHNYRHGQGVPEPVAPSEELAVYVLSSGAAFARQLADFAVLLRVK